MIRASEENNDLVMESITTHNGLIQFKTLGCHRFFGGYRICICNFQALGALSLN